MRLLFSLSLALSLAFAPAAGAAVPAHPAAALSKVTEVEGIGEYRLPNGLRVLLAPDASQATTTVNVTYLVGSRHEGYGETGMAHLLEHLLFKGTPRHANIPQELSRRGMSPNGSTWFDRTNYYETFAADDAKLEWALGMEADRMVNSFIARSDLDSEMTVVRNEMERGENSPSRILQQKMMAAAYQWHNYGKSTIGARSDVENVSIDSLRAFYRKYYRPDNAVLVVSGRFDAARTLDWIQRDFGAIPRPATPVPATYTVEPAQDGERRVTLRRVGDTQLLGTLYHVAAGAHPDSAALELLAAILGDAPTGRLHKRLVETRLATGVQGGLYSLKDPGVMLFSAELRRDDDAAPVRAALLDALEQLGRQPVTDKEVEVARAAWLSAFDDTVAKPSALGIALSEAIAQGDWRLFFLQRDRIARVSAADVNRVAAAYLKPANRTLGHFVPTASPERVEVPATPDVERLLAGYRGQAGLAAGEAFDASPANIDARTRHSQLPGGMKLALLPKKTRGQTVNFSLALNMGDADSLRGQDAVAALTAAMLSRGTARHDREALSVELDRLRASVAIQSDGQRVVVSGSCRRATLANTLDLVAEMLRQPAFPATEFDQLRKQALAGLEASRSQPQAIAAREMARHFNRYPSDDIRYRPTLDEELARLQGVSLAALPAFHARFYGAAHAELAVVGDFDAAALQTQARTLFDGWRAPEPYARLETPYQRVPGGALRFDTPDKPNAVFMASAELPLRDSDPDYPALLAGNYLLGGGFLNSRLATRLRQKEGLSYTVSSSLSVGALDDAGRFGAFAIYAPQNVDKVRTAFREELLRAQRDGFSRQELQDGVDGLLQAHRLQLAQDAALAGKLARYQFLGRDLGYDAELERKLRALTPEQVQAALRKYLNPQSMTEVVAGDFGGVPKAL